jgi:hypothetical protein
MTYLRNYEVIDIQKEKWTLLVAVRRETSKIALPEY